MVPQNEKKYRYIFKDRVPFINKMSKIVSYNRGQLILNDSANFIFHIKKNLNFFPDSTTIIQDEAIHLTSISMIDWYETVIPLCSITSI